MGKAHKFCSFFSYTWLFKSLEINSGLQRGSAALQVIQVFVLIRVLQRDRTSRM